MFGAAIDQVEPHDDPPDHERSVRGWRFEVLYAAGWPMEDARVLARMPSIDLHEAVELLRRCPDPHVARRILL